jgi:hypothetical protein
MCHLSIRSSLIALGLFASVLGVARGEPTNDEPGAGEKQEILERIESLESAATTRYLSGGIVLGLGVIGGIATGLLAPHIHDGCDYEERRTLTTCRDIPGWLIGSAVGSGLAVATGSALLVLGRSKSHEAKRLRSTLSLLPSPIGAGLQLTGTF